MTKRGGATAFLLSLLLVAGAVLAAREAAARVEAWLTAPAPATSPVVVEIRRGQGAASVSRLLAEDGLTSSRRGLEAYLALTRKAGRLRAGEYRFETPPTPPELVDVLVAGRVWLHPYTVREGLDLAQTAALLADLGGWKADELLAAFRDEGLAHQVDPAAPDLEGYLYPETYSLAKGTSARELAEAMAADFRKAWSDLDGDRKAAAQGLDRRQVATLASLVEKETRIPDERPLVASVYLNRYRKGMLLQADPTVIHALELDGAWSGGPVLYGDLKHESPYNTYLHAGLPPGPICSFGKSSLAAALDPAVTEYLYFVATGDGGHRFAATLTEHERNVLLYRRAERPAR